MRARRCRIPCRGMERCAKCASLFAVGRRRGNRAKERMRGFPLGRVGMELMRASRDSKAAQSYSNFGWDDLRDGRGGKFGKGDSVQPDRRCSSCKPPLTSVKARSRTQQKSRAQCRRCLSSSCSLSTPALPSHRLPCPSSEQQRICTIVTNSLTSRCTSLASESPRSRVLLGPRASFRPCKRVPQTQTPA